MYRPDEVLVPNKPVVGGTATPPNRGVVDIAELVAGLPKSDVEGTTAATGGAPKRPVDGALDVDPKSPVVGATATVPPPNRLVEAVDATGEPKEKAAVKKQ